MERDIVSIWSDACKHLKSSLSKDVYERWIDVIQCRSLKDDVLLLGVANDFYQTWLEENYLSLIQKAVASVCGEELSIKLVVDASVKAPGEGKSEAAVKSRARPSMLARAGQSTREFKLNPKYNFNTFVVGPSNNFAHAATMAVAQSPARAYNPLFIYGGVGLGKTHLMQAIGNFVYERSKSRICYISCEAFTNDYIDALQKKGLTQFRKKYRGADLLLIDDIQFLAGKERMQEEFFHTFNALFDSHKQIVLTCDRAASEIPSLEHRLVSRFEWGLVVELETPDLETRIAILRKKREQMNLQLDENIIMFIAENIRSNIRRLEGALIRTSSYASLTGESLTIELVENLLRDTLDQNQSTPVTIEAIQRTVADFYDLRLGDMTSRKRPHAIAFPRQIAMYFCRTKTPNSLPTIGNAFARNHATVLHAFHHVEACIKSDSRIRREIQQLSQKIDDQP